MMSEADLIVFTNDALDYNQTGILAPGCMSEHTVASKYQNEYPNEYFIMYEYQLDYELINHDLPQFKDNIIECVKADIERYNRYWCELISVVKKNMPDLDMNDFLINDSSDRWVLEYSSGSMSIVASLSKCVVIDEPDYDGGAFFEFSISINPSVFVWQSTSSTEIVIKSYYIDDRDNGIRVYSWTDTEMPLIKEMFDELKEVCNRETYTDKRNII